MQPAAYPSPKIKWTPCLFSEVALEPCYLVVQQNSAIDPSCIIEKMVYRIGQVKVT